MSTFDTIIRPIEAELATFRKMQDDLAVNPNPLLREIILHVNKQRGKQMRPMMVMLFSKMFGNVVDATYNAALALELLHTASLVHDDVVDDSMQRRGQASVNAIYNNKLAVLVGDYLLSTALVLTSRCEDQRITSIAGSLGQTLADGEIFQMFHSHEKLVSEEVYYEIIRKKTASLFSSCAEIGALTAGAPDEDVARARQIGEYIGICFQIRDDIFDYFTNDVGKPTGNDLREGKITLPLLYAITHNNDEENSRMRALLDNDNLDSEAIDTLINYAKTHGGIEYAQERMLQLRNQAVECLDILPHSMARQAMIELLDYTISREK